MRCEDGTRVPHPQRTVSVAADGQRGEQYCEPSQGRNVPVNDAG